MLYITYMLFFKLVFILNNYYKQYITLNFFKLDRIQNDDIRSIGR